MPAWRGVRLSLKTVLQLGLGPPALYAIYRLGLITGHYRRLDAAMKEQAADLAKALRPALELPERAQVAHTLGRAARDRLLTEANAVVGGSFRIFGGKRAPIQLTFSAPLQHWTDYERHAVPIPPLMKARFAIEFIPTPERRVR